MFGLSDRLPLQMFQIMCVAILVGSFGCSMASCGFRVLQVLLCWVTSQVCVMKLLHAQRATESHLIHSTRPPPLPDPRGDVWFTWSTFLTCLLNTVSQSRNNQDKKQALAFPIKFPASFSHSMARLTLPLLLVHGTSASRQDMSDASLQGFSFSRCLNDVANTLLDEWTNVLLSAAVLLCVGWFFLKISSLFQHVLRWMDVYHEPLPMYQRHHTHRPSWFVKERFGMRRASHEELMYLRQFHWHKDWSLWDTIYDCWRLQAFPCLQLFTLSTLAGAVLALSQVCIALFGWFTDWSDSQATLFFTVGSGIVYTLVHWLVWLVLRFPPWFCRWYPGSIKRTFVLLSWHLDELRRKDDASLAELMHDLSDLMDVSPSPK